MLGFDRRIVLEDDRGDRRSACLLDTVGGHYFVMIEPDAAEALAAMQAAMATLEDAMELLEQDVQVLDVRSHRFLFGPELVDVLRRSRHQILVALAARLDAPAVGAVPPIGDDLSPQAFAYECQRRTAW